MKMSRKIKKIAKRLSRKSNSVIAAEIQALKFEWRNLRKKEMESVRLTSSIYELRTSLEKVKEVGFDDIPFELGKVLEEIINITRYEKENMGIGIDLRMIIDNLIYIAGLQSLKQQNEFKNLIEILIEKVCTEIAICGYSEYKEYELKKVLSLM